MFSEILNQYNPKDLRSHVILRYFVDDLNEEDTVKFINEIFEKGSWVLSTEISKSSESIVVQEITKTRFYENFKIWVEERINYSSNISLKTKKPLVTIELATKFREILLSIKNLNFSPEIMDLFKDFLDKSHPGYFKNFCKQSMSIVIEEYTENEIEIFFLYFSNDFNSNLSINYSIFIHSFLDELAYSYIIHDLSDFFLKKLKDISLVICKNNLTENYSILISVLLIDLIVEKKLDLQDSKYNDIITEVLTTLDRNKLDDLDFFRFLRRFNYSFSNYDFNYEIDQLFSMYEHTISLLKTTDETLKKNTLFHYYKKSNDYFELFLFYLENISKENLEEKILCFIKLVDELRYSFLTLPYFDDFLNFKTIKGKICALMPKGFEVRIDEDYFHDKFKSIELELISSPKFISHYGRGFLPESSLSQTIVKMLHDSFKNKDVKEIKGLINDEINSFYILALNYSTSYKGKVAQLVPESKSINKLVCKYDLKALFSSVEIFLIEKACSILNLKSPFLKKTNSFKLLCTPDFIQNYNIDLSEDIYWNLLHKIRPSLYESIYINNKKNEELFKGIVLAYENQTIIKGLVKSRTNGGMIIDYFGIEGFLPGSQIDVKPIRDYDIYVGQTMEFKVISINQKFSNFVVSHKILLESEYENQRLKIINQLQKGQILEGYVKNITPYGVFVDLGGVDGLVHITELSWSRINDVNELYEINQKLKVIVLDFDEDKTKIELGHKQLKKHPWDTLDKKLAVGDIVEGKVFLITDYGIFIDIGQGVEGLIHISELSWSTDFVNVDDFFKVGDNVKAVVLTLERDEHKMALGVKQLTDDPWLKVKSNYKVGSRHIGEVSKIVKFGVFVKLEEGIEGLIYNSELSWSKAIKVPSVFLKSGDKIEVSVIDLNIESRKISLSHKNTIPNPFEKYKEGVSYKGIVIEIKKGGAIVSFEKNINAFIPSSHLVKSNGIKLKINDSANFIVIDKTSRGIIASHTLTFRDKKKLQKKDSKNDQLFKPSLNDKIKVKKNDDLTKQSSIIDRALLGIKVGDKVVGNVFQIVDYGVYIKIKAGIESLIRVSEMSWNSNLRYAEDFLRIGDVVEVIVIDIDYKSNQIFSSIKRLVKDPWINILHTHPIGSVHIGKIVKNTRSGLIISLTNDICGFIYFSNVNNKYFKINLDRFVLGEKLEVVVVDLDLKERKMFLGLN